MTKIIYRNYIFESISSGDIPEVLYHGSSQMFSKFELGYSELGQNLNKYGYGIYLTDTIELAEYYSEGTESYLYECRIPRNSTIIEWDLNVDENLYRTVANNLAKAGYSDDAEKLIVELDEYGDTISADSLYNIVSDVIGSENASKLFIKSRIDGFTVKDIHNRGVIYVILDPTQIKILDVQQK